MQTIFKCKRINEMGAQQLLLDTHAIKTLFLGLPRLGDDGKKKRKSKAATRRMNTFAKFVNKEMQKAEVLLKLVGTPTEKLMSSFQILWVGGTSQDLQGIMTLKGLKKSKQQEMLAKVMSFVLVRAAAPCAAPRLVPKRGRAGMVGVNSSHALLRTEQAPGMEYKEQSMSMSSMADELSSQFDNTAGAFAKYFSLNR